LFTNEYIKDNIFINNGLLQKYSNIAPITNIMKMNPNFANSPIFINLTDYCQFHYNSTGAYDCYNFVEGTAIQINIPNYIYHWYQYYYTYEFFNGAPFYGYERWNASNDGYKYILINDQGSAGMKQHSISSLYLYPSIPSSGSQINAFAFYDEMTGDGVVSQPPNNPSGPIVNN